MIVGEAFWTLANATPPAPGDVTGDRVFMVAAMLTLWFYMVLAPKRPVIAA